MNTTALTSTTFIGKESICKDDTELSLITSISSQHSSNSSLSSIKSYTSNLKDYGEYYKGIGEGSSAKVLVIRNRITQKLYAIKQFRKKHKNETEKNYMKKVTSEFCISSTFDHPNIIHTFDLVLNENKRYCTVMEYCPGGDLYGYIMKEDLTKAQKYLYFKQLIQGVAYMHAMGVAHRDIKPENLLIMNGTLKITDFGVSDVFRYPWESNQGRKSDGLVGSEPYIAPEVFNNNGYWGSAADMWSVGIVFCSLLLGGLCWHKAKKTDSSFSKYLRSFKDKNFSFFSGLSLDEQKTLFKLLNPNPEHRITAQGLLNDAFIVNIRE